MNVSFDPERKISVAAPADLGLFVGAPNVRETPRYNYGNAVDGVGGDRKALGSTVFRSLNERNLRTLLGANPDIVHYAVESHVLTYFIPNGRGGFDRHEYVPDVVCRFRNGDIGVIDAKAYHFTQLPSWTGREPFIEEAYRLDHNVSFVVIDDQEIGVQPRLANCEIMEHHRWIVRDDAALARVRDLLVASGFPTTLGQVVDSARLTNIPGECRAYTAIMNMALAGEIHLDLARPFSRATDIWESRR